VDGADDMAIMTLKVNGQGYMVDADPECPLLNVLREKLSMDVGFSCGNGLTRPRNLGSGEAVKRFLPTVTLKERALADEGRTSPRSPLATSSQPS